MSAPTASGSRSAHQRDPLASIPPAARNASGSSPQRARAGADEDHVAGMDLEALRRALEVLGADRVPGLRAVEQDPAREQRRDRVGAELREALGGLDLRVDRDAAVQLEVLGLVAERVDVRAGVLGHHEQGRGARARLPQPRLVAAVELEQHARRVRRPHRRTGVARLLEVVGARARQRVAERGHSTGTSSLPWVSGRKRSAAIAST